MKAKALSDAERKSLVAKASKESGFTPKFFDDFSDASLTEFARDRSPEEIAEEDSERDLDSDDFNRMGSPRLSAK